MLASCILFVVSAVRLIRVVELGIDGWMMLIGPMQLQCDNELGVRAVAVCFCCSQRSLAEIVEMIHTAGLIHKGIVNILSVVDDASASTAVTNSQTDDFKFGNKMAVLSGDFLLANASTGLAALNNTQVRACE